MGAGRVSGLINQTMEYLRTSYDIPRRRLMRIEHQLKLGQLSPGQLCDDLDSYKPDFILESEDDRSENAKAFAQLQNDRES